MDDEKEGEDTGIEDKRVLGDLSPRRQGARRRTIAQVGHHLGKRSSSQFERRVEWKDVGEQREIYT